MIFDSLTACDQYCGVHPRLGEAFAFLEKATREDLPVAEAILLERRRYEQEGY